MRENVSDKIILELDKLEKFCPKYEAELRLLSKKIRTDFWNKNDASIYTFLVSVNKTIYRKYPDRNVCTFALLEDYIDINTLMTT